MKNTITLLLLALTPNLGAAESSIAAKLQLTGDIAARHHSDRKGGTKCGGGAGRVYRDDVRTYSAPLLLDTTAQGTANSLLHVEPHTTPRYEVRLNASVKTVKNETTFRVDLNEAVQKHGEHHWGRRCEHNHFHEYLQSAGYAGQISLRYEVPAGVWAVVIKSDPANAVFLNSAQLPPSNVLMRAPGEGYEIVWVKPGTIVERSFEINADANALHASVAHQSTVTAIGQDLDQSAAKTLLASDEFTQTIDALTGGKKLEPRVSDAADFTVQALSLLRSHAATTAALRELPLERLRWLTDNLFTLTNATLDIKRPAIEVSVKTAAALLSYEVASLTAEEVAPYCEMRYVETSVTGRRLSVLGARYAQFLLSNLTSHLSPKVLSAHQAFVDQLNGLREDKSDYAQVAHEDDAHEPVTRSFELLRKNAVLNRRPFRQAHQDLVEYYRVFTAPSVGTDSPRALLDKMTLLANEEDAFHRDLDAHVASYRATHANAVSTDALQTRLTEMKALAADVSASLTRQGRFLAVDGDAEVRTLLNLMVGFRLKNFGIVATAYADVPFKFEFENVRAAYVDQDRLANNLKIINSCVSEGTRL